MKILNLSIEIVGNKKVESPYLSRKIDFVATLARLSDVA